MEILLFVLALVLGVAASLGGGALSGLRIGKAALGAELAAFMGGLYGVLAGAAGVLVGLIVLKLV